MQRFTDELAAAFRSLRRAPGFAVLALAMLALGIGVNVAIFSVFQTIVLSPLPYGEPDRLVGFTAINGAKALRQPALSVADFRDFRERSTAFENLAAYRPDFASFAPQGADPVQLVCGLVTEDFFRSSAWRRCSVAPSAPRNSRAAPSTPRSSASARGAATSRRMPPSSAAPLCSTTSRPPSSA